MTTTDAGSATATGTETGEQSTNTSNAAADLTSITVTTPATDASEIEKWKSLARKNEERAKANAAAAKELETLRQQSMTDQEKAVATARTEARAEVLLEVAELRVDDAVRAAAAGRPVDVEALLEGIDRRRFVGDDGPDRTAISAWLDKVAPMADPAKPGAPDLGQGARGQTPALNSDQLTQSLKAALGVR